MPADTLRKGAGDKTYTNIAVYTKSAIKEATTPASSSVYAEKVASVSAVKFVDKDVVEAVVAWAVVFLCSSWLSNTGTSSAGPSSTLWWSCRRIVIESAAVVLRVTWYGGTVIHLSEFPTPVIGALARKVGPRCKGSTFE